MMKKTKNMILILICLFSLYDTFSLFNRRFCSIKRKVQIKSIKSRFILQAENNVIKDCIDQEKPIAEFKNIKKMENGVELIEEVYRYIPIENLGMPILPDWKNYYSGKFQDKFWIQNEDQVLIYIPLPNYIIKSDIDVKFNVNSLKLKVKDQISINLNLQESIIPSGSFWILERDKNGENYLQLDLEKRFRMINWNSFFVEKSKAVNEEEKLKSELMKKLFQANQGLSKVTGKPQASIDDLLNDSSINEVTANDEDSSEIFAETDDGKELKFDENGSISNISDYNREISQNQENDFLEVVDQ